MENHLNVGPWAHVKPLNPLTLSRFMKKRLRLWCAAAALAPALMLSSCVAPYYAGPNEATGSVAGALLGAAAGGIIGHQSGSGLEGAAIGGVLGSVLGASAGAAQDQYAYGPPRPVVRRYYYDSYYEPGYAYGYSCPPRRYYHHHSHSPCW